MRAFLPALVLLAASTAHATDIPTEFRQAVSARPFGITLGTTTCNQASKLVNGSPLPTTPDRDEYGNVTFDANEPDTRFPGATMVRFVCEKPATPVVFIGMQAYKGRANTVIGEYADLLHENRFGSYDTCPATPANDGCESWLAPVSKDLQFRNNVIISINGTGHGAEFFVNFQTKWMYDRKVDAQLSH